jgi:hypothetical protein
VASSRRPLGRREAFEATGLPVLGKGELADPIAAEKLVAVRSR